MWPGPGAQRASELPIPTSWLKRSSAASAQRRWARREHKIRPGERGSPDLPENLEVVLRYPENITLGNLAYFVVAPTLCYQPSYPRSRRLRMRWLVRKFGQLMLALGLMLFFMEQYIEPTIANSLEPLKSMVRGLHCCLASGCVCLAAPAAGAAG